MAFGPMWINIVVRENNGCLLLELSTKVIHNAYRYIPKAFIGGRAGEV